MNEGNQSQKCLRYVLAVLVLLLLTGECLLPHQTLEAHTILIAKTIERPAELCRGPEAKGEVGHFLLMNAEIKAVISAADYAYAFSSSGGNILDLARTADNYDGFTHFYTLLNTYWPNQAHYTNVEVLQDGSDGKLAVVRATGYDLGAPNILVVTDYQLGPHDRFVTIVTTLTNRSDQAVRDYAVGDAVQWGVTDNFAPGVGYELLNVNRSFPWVAAQGDQISYGYATDAESFDSMNHSTWTDSYVRHITLPGNSCRRSSSSHPPRDPTRIWEAPTKRRARSIMSLQLLARANFRFRPAATASLPRTVWRIRWPGEM
ncbi:MAG: hypothetical protein HY012_05760 [Acidobacteria bacterium]|nr:hypothetical protein [Acidobacteriota bacterium]